LKKKKKDQPRSTKSADSRTTNKNHQPSSGKKKKKNGKGRQIVRNQKKTARAPKAIFRGPMKKPKIKKKITNTFLTRSYAGKPKGKTRAKKRKKGEKNRRIKRPAKYAKGSSARNYQEHPVRAHEGCWGCCKLKSKKEPHHRPRGGGQTK